MLEILVLVFQLIYFINMTSLQIVDLIFECLDLNFIEFILICLFLQIVSFHAQHFYL